MDAYRAYRGAHAEIRELLHDLDSATDGVSKRLTLRGVAVLICAELEAFLREVVQDRMDTISEPWSGMSIAERKVVAGHALEELSGLVDRLENIGVREKKHAEQVAAAIRRLGSWLDSPGAFAKEVRDASASHFYDPSNASVAIDKLLVQLRSDGLSFFDWMGSIGADPSVYRASVESLVGLRGDVAHQLRQNAQPTVAELRLHQRRVGVIVRLAQTYVSGVRPKAVVDASPIGPSTDPVAVIGSADAPAQSSTAASGSKEGSS